MVGDLLGVLEAYREMCDSGVAGVLMEIVSGGEVTLAEEAIASIARPSRSGQGFSSDPRIRRLIEDHTMQTAADYFASKGWEVNDVHQRNPYDLDCIRGSKRLMVEVKGTTSKGGTVLLTPKEVEHARSHPDEAALFICSNIAVVPSRRGGISTQGGRVLLLHPWKPHPSLLTPLGFSYAVPPRYRRLVGLQC